MPRRQVIEHSLTRPHLHLALQRRRRVLAALLIIAMATLLTAVVAPRPGLWGIHAMVDLTLIAYVAVLLHVRNAAASVEMTNGALSR